MKDAMDAVDRVAISPVEIFPLRTEACTEQIMDKFLRLVQKLKRYIMKTRVVNLTRQSVIRMNQRMLIALIKRSVIQVKEQLSQKGLIL